MPGPQSLLPLRSYHGIFCPADASSAARQRRRERKIEKAGGKETGKGREYINVKMS